MSNIILFDSSDSEYSVVEEHAKRDSERRDNPFENPHTDFFLAVLQLREVLTGDPRMIGQHNLGHPAPKPKIPYSSANSSADIDCHDPRMNVS